MKYLLLTIICLATVFTANSKISYFKGTFPRETAVLHDMVVSQGKIVLQDTVILQDRIFAKDTAALKESVPQVDSAFNADAKLLFRLIERNPTDTLINLIGEIIDGLSAPDNLFMARAAYDYFINPSYMGQERVGVAIAEKYLLGKFKNILPDEEKYSISSYIMLIKPSLVGNRMPELQLYDIKGNPVNVEKIKGFKILYFYTPTCSSCKVETPRLAEFLKKYKGLKINFIAVFSDVPGEDLKECAAQWKAYTDKWFSFENPLVDVYNLWDPKLSSNFPLNYGVISTPQTFFIDRKNIISGRALKTPQLKELTEATNASTFKTYQLLNVFLMENAREGTLTYSGARNSIDNFVKFSLEKPADSFLYYKPQDFVLEILTAMIDFLGEDYVLVEKKPLKISHGIRAKLVKYIQKNYSSYLIDKSL